MITSISTKTQCLTLEALLQEIRTRRLILVADDDSGYVDIWSPNQKQPIALRRAVFKYNNELHQLIQSWDKAVCPSRDLHSRHWRTDTGLCRLCRRLDVSMHQTRDLAIAS